ncbi:MAG: MFS transporter [Gammaproteobacteria bacterium]
MPDRTSAHAHWRILLVLMVVETTASFETAMIYTALSTLYRQFHDPAAVGWLVTGYLLVSAGAAAVCARLGDIYGRTQVLTVMLALAFIGSMVSALADDLGWIIFGRCIQGAAAAILPLCFGVVKESIEQKRVPMSISILAGIASIASGAGMLLGGYLVDHVGWQSIFFSTAAVAALGMVLIFFFLTPSPRPAQPPRIDLLGGVLFVPGVAGVLYAITEAPDWGWGDMRTLGTLAASAAILALWAWHELRLEDPLIDVRALGKRQILLANLAYGLLGLGVMQLALVLLLLVQQPVWTGVGLGVSALMAGVLKLPSNAIAVVAAPFSGFIAGRHGARLALIIGTSLLTAGWGALIFWHHDVWFVVAATTVTGFGMAMCAAAVPNLIVEVAPPDRTSEATGLVQVIRATAMAIGAQVCAILLATSTVSDPAQGPGTYPSLAAYELTLTYITLTSALALAAALALPRRTKTGSE